ncbi:Ubiquitin carboxyl-terminal hydrolase 31 [Liparis tanakae]|uniref:Ubiquitin carboxyl-terminal hydrolase 31 n=1 Tax=Liparis tanakae TaxID=230148 RepID=A0A4Z2G694_9TELE|nr:Ubiquitin carboxyl-terminal hydrolase 31 [Liparis tanakae]
MGSRPPSQASSGSSRRTSLASLSESAEFAGERSEDDGLSGRPAVRGLQRQTFPSRSAIASPLVLSESAAKPSWSHAAKLQLRSHSPSRFSLESHSSSPTLERIGEVADAKPDKASAAKSALAASDGKRPTEPLHSKNPVGAEPRSSAPSGDHVDAVAAAAEPLSPRHAAAAKDPKQRNGPADGACVKRTSASPKKRPAASSTSSSSPSPAVDKLPSRTQTKSGAAAPSPKDGPPKTSKAASLRTATPSKKGLSQTPEVLHPDSAQQGRSGSPGLQSSRPPRRTSPRGGGEKSSASARTKAAERSASRESSRTNVVSEKKASHAPPRAAAGRAEGRPARSSSSSSSMASLRSSSAGVSSASATAAAVAASAAASRAPQRNSKTEEKGLSFFKTALRPKEARKSADGGKAAAAAAAGEAKAKASPEDGAGDASREGIPHGASKKAQGVASEAQTNGAAARDKESSKAAAAKHSLAPAAKPKLSGAEPAPPAAAANAKEPSKKEPAKKMMQSRKIPISSSHSSQRAK